MTIKEIHINLEQSLQTLTGFTNDDLEPEELDIALNKCIKRKINRILDATGDEGFQGDSPNLNQLKNLITLETTLEYVIDINGRIVYKLPTDYFRYLKFRVKFKEDRKCKNDYTGKEEIKPYQGKVRVLEQQTIDYAFNDELRTTNRDNIIASLSTDKVNIYKRMFGNEDVDKVYLDYVVLPQVIKLEGNENSDYSMPDDFVEELIDETAIHLSKVIKDGDKAQLLSSEDIN